MKKTFITLLLIIMAFVVYKAVSNVERKHPPGVIAPAEPRQTMMDSPRSWIRDRYRVTALAEFTLEARVIGKENYRFDRESDLSPVDYVLGWGPMSDQEVLDRLNFSQGRRWYHWYTTKLPIPASEIDSHSANMHMIPSTSEIEKRLKAVEPGDIIELSGYLVGVEADDGWRWRSSLSRTDNGEGSCELVWVEKLSKR